MAAAETTVDSSGPRYAPDDPTLPAPWKGLIDGSTLYYWNPDTNETQYERPAAAVPPLPTGPPPITATPIPPSASGAFSQPSMQLNQVGQVSQQEQPGQTIYPQASHLGKQQPQQLTQQPPFQHMAQHQAPFQHSQQVPYQQQQQMSQQPPAQYTNPHPQPMPYQHSHYMQTQQQQQQQLQPGPQYSYQVSQQPQMPQTAYNQGQQPLISQAAYNQSQQPPQATTAYNQGPQPPQPVAAYNQSPQPPQSVAAYNQGQQPPMSQASYNQGQQPQMPHTPYNQGQQTQGMKISQGQVQPQQSPAFHQPAQVSHVLQASQSQGLQMPSQQGQLQHGFHFTPPQGKQLHHGHVGPQLSQVPHGQQSSTLKVDETGITGGLDGKHSGFSLPLSQQRGQGPPVKHQLPSNHQLPGSHNQPNIPGVGGPSYPAKHHLGGSSPVRPPMGFKMGNNEDHFERNELHSSVRIDVTNTLQQQPKLAALPSSLNRPDMRNGPPYPQPDNSGGYNMGPPHSVTNLHNHSPFPEDSMRPPSRMFTPPNFPSIASADAYRQHHEVTAMGENVPPPFMTFEATGFPPEILREAPPSLLFSPAAAAAAASMAGEPPSASTIFSFSSPASSSPFRGLGSATMAGSAPLPPGSAAGAAGSGAAGFPPPGFAAVDLPSPCLDAAGPSLAPFPPGSVVGAARSGATGLPPLGSVARAARSGAAGFPPPGFAAAELPPPCLDAGMASSAGAGLPPSYFAAALPARTRRRGGRIWRRRPSLGP
ncbi:hypothetical protein GUJ93_ZPchr0011g28720 [Zizania palustris]|uniref:WW domain-containing protein n=1 Tax=Zizania palustris TaxID=103762 RepID=A0A8J6BN55_ZIZPA|nr:hypothetical protein GUJ93_ZPchr0011g28720 [Zizania palustris]